MSYQRLVNLDSATDVASSHSSSLSSSSTFSATDSSVSASPSLSCSVEAYHIKIVLVGSAALTHHCSPNITMGELKRNLFSTELSQNKDIKLIYLGKIIPSDAISLEQLGVESGYALHAFIHDRTQMVDADTHNNITMNNNTEDVIDDGAHHQRPILLYPDGRISDEEQEERLYFIRMRDDYGTNADLLLGYFIGMVLGVLSVFWLCSMQVPYRQKVGIIAGLGTYLILSYFNGGVENQPGVYGGGGATTTTPTNVPTPALHP